MSFLTGYLLADRILAKSTCRREVAAGSVIFEEGAAADGLFLVASGKVEIVKHGSNGEMKLAEVGPEGIFGEMALLGNHGIRSATARTLENSVLVEIRENPMELLREMGESHAAIALLKRVICALGQWIRARNERVAAGTESPPAAQPSSANADTLNAVRAHLPKGFLRFFPRQERLADGEFLLRQGDKSRGFHFVHQGCLDVLTGDGESGGQKVAELHGPTVAGELGYFAGQPRSASLRARGPVIHTYFAGHEFEEIEDSDPEKALTMLFAVAESIVTMLRDEQA